MERGRTELESFAPETRGKTYTWLTVEHYIPSDMPRMSKDETLPDFNISNALRSLEKKKIISFVHTAPLTYFKCPICLKFLCFSKYPYV